VLPQHADDLFFREPALLHGSSWALSYPSRLPQRMVSFSGCSSIALTEELPGSFVCAEVAAFLEAAREESFGLTFLTLGSLFWVRDIFRFFRSIHHVSQRGAPLVIWDFHPMAFSLSDDLTVGASYPELGDERFHTSGIVDYVSCADDLELPISKSINAPEGEFRNSFPVWDRRWSLGTVVSAVAEAGFLIEELVEWNHIFGERYVKGLVRREDGTFGFPAEVPRLPLTFGVRARRT
jgi:hypothetical protein